MRSARSGIEVASCPEALHVMHVDISPGSHPIHVRMVNRAPDITKSANPSVDATAWPRFVDRLINPAEDLVAR